MTKHIAVLKTELVDSLSVTKGNVVVDCTLGGGGHALEVMEKLENAGGGVFVGIDIDSQAIENFRKKLKKYSNIEVKLVKANFAKLEEVLQNIGLDRVSKLYADLGFSSDQIEDITFRKDKELDLRMDDELYVKAKDLLNGLYRKELEKLFREYGDVKYAGPLAREIELYKKTKPIERTSQLNAIVKTVLNNNHKLTLLEKELQKIYQSMRIAVNGEFVNLEKMLSTAIDKLEPNGRIAIIAFHSGEDRIVKRTFKDAVRTKQCKWIKELVVPSNYEVSLNPKSRSSKMRVLGKM